MRTVSQQKSHLNRDRTAHHVVHMRTWVCVMTVAPSDMRRAQRPHVRSARSRDAYILPPEGSEATCILPAEYATRTVSHICHLSTVTKPRIYCKLVRKTSDYSSYL